MPSRLGDESSRITNTSNVVSEYEWNALAWMSGSQKECFNPLSNAQGGERSLGGGEMSFRCEGLSVFWNRVENINLESDVTFYTPTPIFNRYGFRLWDTRPASVGQIRQEIHMKFKIVSYDWVEHVQWGLQVRRVNDVMPLVSNVVTRLGSDMSDLGHAPRLYEPDRGRTSPTLDLCHESVARWTCLMRVGHAPPDRGFCTLKELEIWAIHYFRQRFCCVPLDITLYIWLR
jgi:hypothetical protein